MDFVKYPEQREDLLERIEEHSGGTVYYRPMKKGES